jgi:hypothetical protein
MLDTRYWILDTGYSILDARYWIQIKYIIGDRVIIDNHINQLNPGSDCNYKVIK